MKSTRIALVTGATSGIGEATAYRLQARGYEVFAAGRNPAALENLRSRGIQARALDVTDEAAVTRLVEEIQTVHGPLDVLVNNAGFGLSGPLEQVALSDLRSILETNVVAMLHLSQAVLPGMRARGAGTIINIGSTAGRWTSPGAGAYHISKYGVAALSQVLGAEVRPFGVRVVLIEPTGVRDTSFIESRRTATLSEAENDPYGDLSSNPPPRRVRSSCFGVAWQAAQPPAKNMTLPLSRFGVCVGRSLAAMTSGRVTNQNPTAPINARIRAARRRRRIEVLLSATGRPGTQRKD